MVFCTITPNMIFSRIFYRKKHAKHSLYYDLQLISRLKSVLFIAIYEVRVANKFFFCIIPNGLRSHYELLTRKTSINFMNVQSILCSKYEETQLEHVGCALLAFEYSIIAFVIFILYGRLLWQLATMPSTLNIINI